MNESRKQPSNPISIVIPAWNEAERLPRTLLDLRSFLSQENVKAEVWVVDDGSTDSTVAQVQELQQDWPDLFVASFAKNRGKGAAVREGLKHAKNPRVLIADADGSTPWKELLKLEAKILSAPSLAMATRAAPESEITIRQAWWREAMGKMFNLLLRGITGLPYKDTQCGFKLFFVTPKLRKSLLSSEVDRFAWDVEWILLTLQNSGVVSEVPVRWAHQEASRVHPLWDSLEMLWSVSKVRLRIMRRKNNL